MKRSIKIILGLGILLVAAALAGAAYEQVGRERDRTRFPQVGRSFHLGERTLNLYCSGEGEPTVVFDSSAHTAGYRWVALQPQVATFTRACWYDRAGYGWSDAGPSPRTFGAVANDLHTLLRAGEIQPPYILVGEGLAGFHVRVYTGLFPGEVAGAVLVDSNELAPVADEEGSKGPLGGLSPKVKTLACAAVLPSVVRLGLQRLLSNGRGQLPIASTPLSPDQQTELIFLSNTPVAQLGGEGCTLDQSLSEVRTAGTLGSLPLVVITSTNPGSGPSRQGQPQLVALSKAGRQVLVDSRDAMSNAMTQAIRGVVNSVRQDSGR
jgi:pimeloyl-ACP methyl ester carboxylesterase